MIAALAALWALAGPPADGAPSEAPGPSPAAEVAPPPSAAADQPASSTPPPTDDIDSLGPAAETANADPPDDPAALLEPPPPTAATPRRQTPLPPPPDPVDPSRLDKGPWRGHGWVTLRIDVVAPVGGQRPARGSIVSAAGGIWAGYRIRNYVGVFGGVTTFLHDRETTTQTDPQTGEVFESTTFGRLTLVDLAVVRLWWPTRGRVQPFIDVGGFVGGYRSPLSDSDSVGGGRFGAGLDVWLGPTFSLNFGVDERLIAIKDSIGHTLQAGFGAALHW